MINDPVIRISDADIGFKGKTGDHILLKDLFIDIRQSELVALIGKNGTGKTTLLKTIIQLHHLISGNIHIDGKDLESYKSSQLAQKIGYASSVISGIPEMTVEELVRIGRYPYTNLFGVLKEDDLKIVDKAIHFCGLENYKQTLLSHMSDGERQRAVLARVFAQDTGIMLLDEPTSFLDIPNKFEIFDLLRNLSENGKTIIFTTHDLNLATLYADKILLIHDRSIISGAPEDLYLRPELKSQFVSNKLKMNSKTGEFIPHIHPDKKIILTSEPGCENAEIWTRKALTRKGYSVISSEKEKIEGNDSIDIYKEKDKFVWNLHRDKQNLLIPGIYELILKLENN